MVLSLKYYGALWLARDLSLLLSLAFHNRFADIEVDIMMPVPLHRRKFRERGFNQAWSLVQGLARRLDIPATDHCLLRSRYTATQTNLTVTQRAANVKRAFDARWPEWLEGRRVLLVDDVMTTGATMNACARALKENGAARVYALTAARGVN
jgi:ComF family protein